MEFKPPVLDRPDPTDHIVAMARKRHQEFNGFDPRSNLFGKAAPKKEAETRTCQWPGCTEKGEHRAPWSRDDMTRSRWFCLEHARLYNESWNYYAGMDEIEVEADRRADTIGRRPTWPMGTRAAAYRVAEEMRRDPFGFFEDEEPDPHRHRAHHAHSAEDDAMAILDLRPPVTIQALKARYKKLVKRYHPDANGGDKTAEEKFKQVNEAYRTIMASLTQ